MSNIIEFVNVFFKYDAKTPVLHDMSFKMKKGTYTVMLGKNGSGKSTIAKLIIGLFGVTSGNIYVDDILLDEESVYDIRKDVAIVFQNPDNQFVGATVRDDIAFGLENRCVKQNLMNDIIEEYAGLVGMKNFLDREPSTLSGGQKQRVAIAGALSVAPKLLILDESTSMLDPIGKKEIFALINKLRKENPKMSILSITHHIDEAINCDEIVIVNDGKIIKNGKPEDILYDQQLLKENFLEVPFAVEVSEQLKKVGIDIGKNLTMEELVNKLCQ